MWRSVLAVMLLAGCVQLPPSPQDLQAKRFETVAGKAVVYLYREQLDFVDHAAGVMLDDQFLGTTYRGTYLHLVLAPGRHRIAGFAGDAGVFEFDAQPGKIYFAQQSVTRMMMLDYSRFRFVREDAGRRAVLRSELIIRH